MKKIMKTVLCVLLIIAAVGAGAAFGISGYVKSSVKEYILDPSDTGEGYDCILVLGCGVYGTTPSHMLEDRLLRGVELYKNGVSNKLLMSGDHGRTSYDEVNVMKSFATENGVPSEDVFMDHAGFSTYESMYRARDVFKAEKILIVTQEYHLYRAVYDARALGLDAYGTVSMPRTYQGQLYRDIREVLARDKDFFYAIFKPEPKYLGEAIPVQGDGNLTNDK